MGTHGSDLETTDYDLLAISYDGLKFDYQRIGVVHRRRYKVDSRSREDRVSTTSPISSNYPKSP